MPRHPDPELEARILKAAQSLWKRGGEKALTMRSVARAAGTNTPAVYRRFKNRRDLVRGILMLTITRLRRRFEAGGTVEAMAEAYIDEALSEPNEYQLFYTYGHELFPTKPSGRARPIRESRPNFAFLELQLAQRLGGPPQEHTELALALWAMVHGTASLLLSKSVPPEHTLEMRLACRKAVRRLIEDAARFSAGSQPASRSQRRSG